MAEYDVKNQPSQRMVYVKMSGFWSDADVDGVVKMYYQRVTYNGRTHMVIADMRGMKPMQPTVAERLGRFIAETRKLGVVLCAHISDHTVQRLQAARVVRQSSPMDDITVDVASLEEAHKVLSELRSRLDDPRYQGIDSRSDQRLIIWRSRSDCDRRSARRSTWSPPAATCCWRIGSRRDRSRGRCTPTAAWCW